MSWFNRRPKAEPISRSLSRAEMERFGRYTIRSMEALQADVSWSVELIMKAYERSQVDQDGFISAMVRVAEGGQWAALGAARMWFETGIPQEGPRFDAIMRSSTDFLRSRGIPRRHLTGYENDWWSTHSEGEAWLRGRPTPEPYEAPIQPLGPGEVRRVANMGPEGNDNDILVTHSQGNFKALIEGRHSEEEPRLARTEWYEADSLYDLYVRVGEALTTPPPFMDPQLTPYVPLPAPDFT